MPCEKFFTLRNLRRRLRQFNEITFMNMENIKSHDELIEYEAERNRMKYKLDLLEKIKTIKSSTGECLEKIPNLIRCRECERN